jgi:hypothetical protein
VCHEWTADVAPQQLMNVGQFLSQPLAPVVLFTLLLIAISGGMFVVPLYAFLTTTVDKSQTARTVAANNIVNSGAMVVGSLLAFSLTSFGVGPVGQLLLVAGMCLVAAWLGWKLHLACD